MGHAVGTHQDRFESLAPKLGHQPTFDGMRGYFMVSVILAHGFYTHFASFAAAVDVFFVISGFLITTLLLEEDRKTSTIDLRQFYKRRALRLLPMLYIVIGLTVLGVWIATLLHGADTVPNLPAEMDPVSYGQLWETTKSDAIAGSFYMYHVIHPVGIELVDGTLPQVRPLIQLWSLSVEEHYYVFGVLVTLWAVRKKMVTPLVVVFMAAYVFIGVARLLDHLGPNLAWYQRPDAIMLGVVLAFVNARIAVDLSERWRRVLGHAATIAALVFAATVFVGTSFAKPLGIFVPFGSTDGGQLSDRLYWGQFGFTLCSLSIAVVVFAMVRCERHWLKPILAWRPAISVGVRSYGLYLIHVPLFVVLVYLFPDHAPLVVLAYLPLLFATAELGHRFVEQPLMRARKRSSPLHTPEPTVDLRGTDDPTRVDRRAVDQPDQASPELERTEQPEEPRTDR